MSHDEKTRMALAEALKLVYSTRKRIAHNDAPCWEMAMSALVVLMDQHNGRWAKPEWRAA